METMFYFLLSIPLFIPLLMIANMNGFYRVMKCANLAPRVSEVFLDGIGPALWFHGYLDYHLSLK